MTGQCPAGHPADGAPCVSYRCERLEAQARAAWETYQRAREWLAEAGTALDAADDAARAARKRGGE